MTIAHALKQANANGADERGEWKASDRAVLAARRRHTLRDLRDLKALSMIIQPAATCILPGGAQPAHQLSLF